MLLSLDTFREIVSYWNTFTFPGYILIIILISTLICYSGGLHVVLDFSVQRKLADPSPLAQNWMFEKWPSSGDDNKQIWKCISYGHHLLFASTAPNKKVHAIITALAPDWRIVCFSGQQKPVEKQIQELLVEYPMVYWCSSTLKPLGDSWKVAMQMKDCSFQYCNPLTLAQYCSTRQFTQFSGYLKWISNDIDGSLIASYKS